MLSILYAVKEAKYVKLLYIALHNVTTTLEKCLEVFFYDIKHLFHNNNFSLDEPYGRPIENQQPRLWYIQVMGYSSQKSILIKEKLYTKGCMLCGSI